jgi:hypothetical protein
MLSPSTFFANTVEPAPINVILGINHFSFLMRFFYFTHSARLLEFRTSKLLQVTFTKISMFNYKTAEYSIQERPGVLAVTRAVRELIQYARRFKNAKKGKSAFTLPPRTP